MSPDGQNLLLNVRDPKTLSDLWILQLSGERKATPYIQAPFNQDLGQVSPDGRWVAYVSNESGLNQVWVQSFPSPGTRYQVSTAGGTMPRWRGDGRELFYIRVGLGETLMSVSVETRGPGLRFATPEPLFDSYASIIFSGSHLLVQSYSVTKDGNRFLVARQVTAEGANAGETPLTVVLNWPAALGMR